MCESISISFVIMSQSIAISFVIMPQVVGQFNKNRKNPLQVSAKYRPPPAKTRPTVGKKAGVSMFKKKKAGADYISKNPSSQF